MDGQTLPKSLLIPACTCTEPVHRSGRSVGTATVVFQSRDDALTAFNRYNNVALDNKRMAIEVVEQAVPRGTFKTLSSGIK